MTTRTLEAGQGFSQVRVRVAKKYPRVIRDEPYAFVGTLIRLACDCITVESENCGSRGVTGVTVAEFEKT